MFNLTLFDELECEPIRHQTEFGVETPTPLVPGLRYFRDFINRDEEIVLLAGADSGPWASYWKRRTQHFGVRYGSAKKDEYFSAAIPTWAEFMRERLVERGIFAALPGQMGINEYEPGQGISAHVDYREGTVVSLSLGSGCIMDFAEIDGHRKESMWLPRRSIVVLNGNARHLWTHGIAARLKDTVNGHVIARTRRVSLTFRNIIDDHEAKRVA